MKETSGPFVITVFTAPEPLRAGPADVSVLVQERTGGAPILDALVSIALASDTASVRIAEATHAQATNKLLYATPVDFPAPGTWTLRLEVRHGPDIATLSTDLSVSAVTPALQAIWVYVCLPVAAVLLFALHQWRAGRMPAAG